jgi:hypothetical protein
MTESPDLWKQRLTEAVQRAEALCDGLSHEDANRRPAPGKWSVAECIAHLNRSMQVYDTHVAKAVQRAAGAREGEPPFSRGTLYGALLLWALRKGATRGRKRMKVPALPMFKPEKRKEWAVPEVLRDFRNHIERLVGQMDAVRDLDLGRLWHGTPLPLCRIALKQTFELHSLHSLRHIEQAERTLNQIQNSMNTQTQDPQS